MSKEWHDFCQRSLVVVGVSEARAATGLCATTSNVERVREIKQEVGEESEATRDMGDEVGDDGEEGKKVSTGRSRY